MAVRSSAKGNISRGVSVAVAIGAATGAAAMGVATTGWGAACGAGSLTMVAGTDVSPVNGFLYSLFVVMTSMVLG